jgi:hypothetical protein
MWDIVMDECGAGAGFLRELRFLLPMYIPSASPQSSSLSSEAGTKGQKWPQCQLIHKPNKKKTPARAIAQVVSRRLSHRGGPDSNPCLVMLDFVMDKSGAGAGFLRELRFLLPIYIPSASPQSSSLSPEAGTIGTRSGRSANSLTNQIRNCLLS